MISALLTKFVLQLSSQKFMTSCYGNEHFASAYYPHQTDFHRLIHLAYSVITTIVVHNGGFKAMSSVST